MSSSPKAYTARPWLVLKFGGTSVSSVANWHNIAQVLRTRIAERFRPVVVHSALSGITDRLEAPISGASGAGHGPTGYRAHAAIRSLYRRASRHGRAAGGASPHR